MTALTYMSSRIGPLAVRQSDGHGLPILMLHGVGYSGEVFARQFDSPLATMHRLVAIDLPGHGHSARSNSPHADYTIAANADLVAEAIGELGLSRTIVFGWSLGGHIGFELMGRYPELLAGVMACGAPPIGRGIFAALRGFQFHWELLLAGKETYSRSEAERFARFCFGDVTTDAHVEMILSANGPLRSCLNRSLMHGDGVDQKAVVETSPVPLALVNGERDPVVRTGHLDSIAYANLWEGVRHTIPGAGHAPFLSAPNAFNALLHRFAVDMAVRSQIPHTIRPMARSA